MKDDRKTKAQLINELEELRRRITELESLQSESMRAEELKRTRDHLDSIIESSLDGIYVTEGRKGVISKANKDFLELVGWREEEVIGKHVAEFSPTKEGTYESITGELVQIDEKFFHDARTIIDRLFKEGKITNFESYLIGKDMKVIPVEINITLRCDEEGDVLGAQGIVRNIAERKRAEKEIESPKIF